MISLIKVRCPHCGAEGQIMVPPLGAIILGPCPECQELVVVFCGQVLPLDKQVMLKGSREERKEHLYRVLKSFLRRRIDRLFQGNAGEGDEDSDIDMPSMGYLHRAQDSEGEKEELPDMPVLEEEAAMPVPAVPRITEEEVASFLAVDLKLIDNRDYFKAVFE